MSFAIDTAFGTGIVMLKHEPIFTTVIKNYKLMDLSATEHPYAAFAKVGIRFTICKASVPSLQIPPKLKKTCAIMAPSIAKFCQS
jgi:intracellular sulfur oxidation DsrE/DsrF family protein